jgi:glycosyltransferase involved in cell wall biosynthesis
MRLAWSAIVKNESARILRCMESLRPHISCYAVTDTGSTDETINIIKEYFELHGIPGVVTEAPFEDFSQARNAALTAARSLPGWDYALLCDADMQLVVDDPTWLDGVTGPSYDMVQIAGVLHYQNRRFISRACEANYLGVTHEYLNAPTGGCIPEKKAYFVDHADGANRPDKFQRDIDLFKKDLLRDPNNVRTMYYLAQSYRDAGKSLEAAKWFERRIAAGGWDEEVWSAMQNLAFCHRDMGDVSGFVYHALRAYEFRPSRMEVLHELAKFYREKGSSNLAVLFAEAGMDLPASNDALFVNDYVYKCGLKDEFSIAAFYVPAKRKKGFDVIDQLCIAKHPYEFSRRLAEANVIHYMKPLAEWCPSFKWRHIEFQAEENWTAMNPSLTLHTLPDGTDQLKALVRTVNYRMDAEGRYLIRGTDGTITNSNPINTRSWLVPLSDDLRSITQIEVVPPPDLPLNYPLVIGFEDMRIFSKNHDLWASSTVRQFDADGVAEQVIAHIGGVPGGGTGSTLELNHIFRMRRTPRLYEKNWAPFVDGDRTLFMYRPGHVVDDKGQDVSIIEPPYAVGHFAGSGPLVRHNGSWIGIVHEARYHLGTSQRYYQHRFVVYSQADYSLRAVSKPFYFNDKVIEFAAGLAKHPTADEFVISYGWRDCEARIARVSTNEVWEFIWTEGQRCG